MPFILALIWTFMRTAVKMKNEINELKARIMNRFVAQAEEPQAN